MVDPVMAADGFTYERSEIEAWFQGHATSPQTGNDVPNKTLLPNLSMKSQISTLHDQASAPSLSSDDATCWSKEQVAEWVMSIGSVYAVYGAGFIGHGIDGRELMDKDFGNDELDEIKVLSKSHRKRILKEIKKLRR